MNELTVFNKDVIPVYETDEGRKVVIGRELHENLKVSTAYKDWFPRMCEYGFSEPEDYCSFLSDRVDGLPGKPRNDHYLTLEMAKHIAMIQRSPEGKAIRDKLIALETNVAELSPELRCMIRLELAQKQQAKALEEMNRKVDSIGELVALNPNAWREECRRLIVAIAHRLGSNEYIREVTAEIYKLVDERAGVALGIRLANKQRRMAEEGVPKSKRDKLTKVDIIAEDKKLTEIYIKIVGEMAIKYGVSSDQKAS